MTSSTNDDTCFVRNLPFSVDDAKLTELFAEVGPVKKAFLVKKKGSSEHKGFGFVTFALKEDAAAAVKQLQHRKIDGRALQVEVAQRRDSLDVRNEKRRLAGEADIKGKKRPDASAALEVKETETAPVPAATARPAPGPARLTTADKTALCQAVAIGGFPANALPAVLQLVNKAGQVTKVEDPVPEHVAAFAKLQQDGCTGHAIVVHFKSGQEAFHAVWKLHRQAVGTQQKELLWARQVNGEGAHVKQWRVILRNLPFGITEAQLIELLAKVGFVWGAHVPKLDNGRMKGFGFVSFTCRAHAAAAIDAINSKELKGRVVAADWSIAKAAFNSALTGSGPKEHVGDTYGHGPEAAQALGHEAAQEDRSESEDAGGDGAQAAQDGVERSGGSPLQGDSDEDGSDVSEDGDVGDDTEMVEGLSGDGEASDADTDAAVVTRAERDMLQRVLGSMLGPGEAGAGDAEAAGSAEAASAKAVAAGAKGRDGRPAKVGAAEADPGPCDWEGERSEAPAPGEGDGKGSGIIRTQVFVRNVPIDATKFELSGRLERFGPIKACRLVMNQSTGKPKGTAFVEFTAADSALKAIAACQAQRDGSGLGVALKGKLLSIDPALVQDSARDLAQKQDGYTGKAKDKRNLYLCKEGLIEEGSALWQQLSPGDQKKRQAAQREKSLKLKSPNFFVSPTRLHLMNIPLSWDSQKVKAACREAVLARASKARPKVKQCIVLRDMTRLDEQGEPKSRGAGFVEFESHEDALVCLRQMNNNPALFGGATKRPIVEFAIENVKILKTRDRKLRYQAERLEQRALAEDAEDDVRPEEGPPASEHKRKRKAGKRDDERGAKKARLRDGREQAPGVRPDVAAQPARHGARAGEDTTAADAATGQKTPAQKKRARQAAAAKRRSKGSGEGELQHVRASGPEAPAAKPRDPSAAAKKGQQQAKVQQRRKSMDDAIDNLASSAVDQQRPAQKHKRRKKQTDDLDVKITQRARQLFGLAVKSSKAATPGKVTVPLNSRWFD